MCQDRAISSGRAKQAEAALFKEMTGLWPADFFNSAMQLAVHFDL
jgi:hypothetical protein